MKKSASGTKKKGQDNFATPAQEQEGLARKAALRIPTTYWYVGLLAIMLFSIYLRAILPWKAVFAGNNTVMFSSESDAWYNMMLAKSTVLNLHRTFYDPLTNFPYGTSIHFGGFRISLR